MSAEYGRMMITRKKLEYLFFYFQLFYVLMIYGTMTPLKSIDASYLAENCRSCQGTY